MRSREVDRPVAMLYAAAARAEALEMNRDGRYQESGIRLRLTSEKIAEYAADDPVLGAHIRDLRERDMPMASAPMSPGARKRSLAASFSLSRMRDAEGQGAAQAYFFFLKSVDQADT